MMWFEIKPCKPQAKLYSNPDAEVGNLVVPCQQLARSTPKTMLGKQKKDRRWERDMQQTLPKS